MSRPICWECGHKLMYVNGRPVFAVYTDPTGAEHKMHKDCFKFGGYSNKPITAAAVTNSSGTTIAKAAP